MAGTNSMTRIGIVSAVDSDKKRARVYYPDMDDMVSDWLFVLQRSGTYTSSSADGHSHSVHVGTWMPEINDRVFVAYLPGFNTDGFILGVIP